MTTKMFPEIETSIENMNESGENQPDDNTHTEQNEGRSIGQNDAPIDSATDTIAPCQESLTTHGSVQVEKSDVASIYTASTSVSGYESSSSRMSAITVLLPWGAQKETIKPQQIEDLDLRPGEYVMRTLFADFASQAERKIEAVMIETEKPLSKVLQRGEDSQFDQLLLAFGTVAEHCLPSILRALFKWYERQLVEQASEKKVSGKEDQKGKSIMSSIVSGSVETVEKPEADLLQERRDLAVEFIFCLMLIEILRQLSFHPGHEDIVNDIENISFKHFKYREGIQNEPNAINIHIIADLFAEVIGVLAQSRFLAVRKRFMIELKDLRSKEPGPHTTQSIISLLMGMKFFRVKMVPIEEFEASFQFMQECAQYFLDVKDKDVKHALAGLFVEILVPVAAAVKNEVNVPCLKNFVEMLYSTTLDMCTKSKHRLAIFPLVTCLLCVSQKTFFLQNWHYFLAMCLSHLKTRDTKMSRVALEALYRLLWVYMIRIKCESNSATQSRLQSIVNSLFPKGSKAVMPRDTPLNIFVKIIQFIAQERLDFAMREIVFDLLSVGRPVKIILTPERMSIGLRAFLVVADSLQQKEGEPPMPRTMGVLPSGNTMRVKKTFLNKMLTEDTARSIGMSSYFPHVRRVFVDILRALDVHYGRPLMMTSTQNFNKEPDEMITGERKPRIDLFRTCVAAVPRLIPDGMTGAELVDLLSRLTVHMDEELRGLAYQSLQTLVLDFSDWRHDVILGFTQFLIRDVQDTFPQLVDNGLRMLLQLLTSWKNSLLSPNTRTKEQNDNNRILNQRTDAHNNSNNNSSNKKNDNINIGQKNEQITSVFYLVEGFALVMLCNCRLCPRRIAVHILREVKLLLKTIGNIENQHEQSVIDVIDATCPLALEKCYHMLPPAEKAAAAMTSNVDLLWIAERSSCVWTAGFHDENSTKSSSLLNLSGADPWSTCLFTFLERNKVLSLCPTATAHSWPIVFNRINSLFTVVDPTPVNDNRASLLRSSTAVKKPINERDVYMHIWKNYLTFGYRVVPPIPSPIIRCASPDLSLSSSPDSLSAERGDNKSPGTNASPAALYKLTVPLLRCESVDVRDAVVQAIGKVNADALKDLMEELVPYIREAVDRKQENMRRRRRRDALRLQLVRVLELVAEYGTFGICPAVLDRETQSLHPTFVEYIDGARIYLENENDKDAPSVRDIKLHFCNFIRKMIKSFSLEACHSLLKRDLRRNLFTLFATWSGPFGKPLNSLSACDDEKSCTELQLSALQAMSGLLCCGPCFNPQSLSEEGAILYQWLDLLLASKDEKIYALARETVVLLLEGNPDIGTLLDWVVDRCYTGLPQVADGCFLALATIFSAREYPCDHYTSVINVSLMNTGCPRAPVQDAAFQLLQLLDQRFFGNIRPLPAAELETGHEDITPGVIPTLSVSGGLNGVSTNSPQKAGTLDALLTNSYCRNQMFLSRQLAQLHPELTMPMFSEITHRFQTARREVRQLLLQYLLPWLHNMELVDPNVPPPSNSSSYYQYYTSDVGRGGSKKEGWGSAEATEMVLNNLFYITTKFSDEHPKEVEELWSTLCGCWPNNLKIIIRYLIIVSGMAPQELLPYAKRVVLFLARSRPERLVDEMMSELQTVETLNCLIERTETPPFYRLTSMRKASSHSDAPVADPGNPSRDLSIEKGTIHTKRHSGEDPVKTGSKSDTALRTLANYNSQKPEKTRTTSGPAILPDDLSTLTNEIEINDDVYLSRNNSNNNNNTNNTNNNQNNNSNNSGVNSNNIINTNSNSNANNNNNNNNSLIIPIQINEKEKFDIPQPHPLPMPEYGGYFAPLTEYLPDASQPISGFHRCNIAVMLLTDVIVDGISLDWSIHVPLMLHIIFLGLDHSRFLVRDHCRLLLINLLVVLSDHRDHLGVARVLLAAKTESLNLGLTTPALPIHLHNFTEVDPEFDSYLFGPTIGNQILTPPRTNSPPPPAPVVAATAAAVATVVPSPPPSTPPQQQQQQLQSSSSSLTPQMQSPSPPPPPPMPPLPLISTNIINDDIYLMKNNSSPIPTSLESSPSHSPVPTNSLTPPNSTIHVTDIKDTSIIDNQLRPWTNNGINNNNNNDNNNQLPVIVTPEDAINWTGTQLAPNMPIQDIIKSLINFLSIKTQLLWNYEDMTAKIWYVKSAEQLTILLRHVLKIFRDSLPQAHISQRWAETALQLGLSCSSRHYAGRSLQVFRALRVPITSRMLSDILSRLVETVAEQGEDMQGYVTELLLTLEAAVDSLESDFRPLDFMKEIFKSTPNLNNKETPSGLIKRNQCIGGYPTGQHMFSHLNQIGHTRSTSYSVSYCMRKTTTTTTASSGVGGGGVGGNNNNINNSGIININDSKEIDSRNSIKYPVTNLSRSRSAQSLKLLGDSATQDDKMTILAQLFWLSVSLLESDYEHEFLLALRLLGRVLHRLPLDRPDARDKVEKLQQQLGWNSFPGVHALLLKGCTSPNTYEQVVVLLSQFTPLLDLSFIDPTQNLAFPMNVISLLPYMLLNYEDANELCIRSAENIAQVSAEKGKKLDHLGTVMTLYSRRTFSKESFQWTKCVVKYLYDTYAHLSFNMLAFLVEVLEKGPANIALPVLSIIHCLLHYVDLASRAAQPINTELLRVISKYVEGPYWKEALKVLKLVVTRSSTLVAPPTSGHGSSWESSLTSPHPSFTDTEIFTKKELPGRTMDFTFDVMKTPVIGKRWLRRQIEDDKIIVSPSMSLSPADSNAISGWKRPWMSQGRVRECLVNLLRPFGQPVGLPKSPSVIFSQSSDLMERQSSMASSTEEVSGANNDLSGGSRRDDEQFGVFKDFDFLEYESESVEGESTDNFNWGVRRRPLSEGEEKESSFRIFEESLSEKTISSSKNTSRRSGGDGGGSGGGGGIGGGSSGIGSSGVGGIGISNISCGGIGISGMGSGIGGIGLISGCGLTEESSDDEIGSESPLDEVPSGPCIGQDQIIQQSGLYHPSSLSLIPTRSRNDSSTRSDTSGSSTGDLGDVTPCNASPNLSALMPFRQIHRDDNEEIWCQQIQLLINKTSINILDYFNLLNRILRDVSSKSVGLSREAVSLLTNISSSSTSSSSQLAINLSIHAELLSTKAELPFVYFSVQLFTSQRLNETLKFCMLEIQEHLETFLDKKDHATECLDAIKSTHNDDNNYHNGNDDMLLGLGRAFYKLHFQLLLLIEASNKMLLALTKASRLTNTKLYDLSIDILIMKTSLLKALEESTESERGTPTPTPSPSPLPMTNNIDEIQRVADLLKCGKWSLALDAVRLHRAQWPGEAFHDDDDITTAVNMYCKYIDCERNDLFVITKSDNDIIDIFDKLMESLFQVLAGVTGLEAAVKAGRAQSSHTKSDC
ncbi:protein furry isoform X2 [Aphidius gifuensis]|uniref:protein furry isoform X2 n=1 Tax=Aphidius gifuensis TaxID=684658 RepID=UPI001CDD5352|nr:protein furry isoform X2 [Aphidius gifuensis]